MKILPKALCFVCFLGAAATAALSLNGLLDSPVSGVLVFTAALAVLTALPGLIYRPLWPLTLLLLPVAAYLLLRVILPLPGSVSGIGGQARFYVDALRMGGAAYTSESLPYSIGAYPELRLLLTLVVYWVAGLAALVGLGLRRAIPGVFILVLLMGFGVTASPALRSIGSAVAFLLLAVCLLVPSRGLQRADWRLRDALTGAGIGAVGIGLALALLLAVPSTAATPWKDWRAWDPFRQGGSGYTFNWLQDYPELLDPNKNHPVMSVQSPLPSYWKANSLDTFDGISWTTAPAPQQRLDLIDTEEGYTFAVPPPLESMAGEKVYQVFDLASVHTNYLFVGGDPEIVVLPANTDLRVTGVGSLVSTNTLGPDLRYHAVSVIPVLKAQQLVDRGSVYPEAIEGYLALPFPAASELVGPDPAATWKASLESTHGKRSGWSDLYTLSQEIVGDATDPYEKTLRIEKYLRGSYRYTLRPRQDPSVSPYASFLFGSREGYCQHFAGAMALLLRYNGIPSRVAVGFTAGDLRGGRYAVGTNNAHAWVEAYFPGAGWVAFDPTPGRNLPTEGGSSTTPGFLDPFAAEDGAGEQTVTTRAPLQQEPDVEAAPMDREDERGGRSKTAAIVVPLAAVFVLIAWPVSRAAWRSRGLRRGTHQQRLAASLRLLRTHLAEYGAPVGPASTTEEVVSAAEHMAAGGVDPGLAGRLDAVLFGGRAPTHADVESLKALRKRMKARMRQERGWTYTVLAWYGFPPRARDLHRGR